MADLILIELKNIIAEQNVMIRDVLLRVISLEKTVKSNCDNARSDGAVLSEIQSVVECANPIAANVSNQNQKDCSQRVRIQQKYLPTMSSVARVLVRELQTSVGQAMEPPVDRDHPCTVVDRNRRNITIRGNIKDQETHQRFYLYPLHPDTSVGDLSTYLTYFVSTCLFKVNIIKSNGEYASFKLSLV